MVLSKADLRFRKDNILAIVVDHYIQTITPVSSSYIAKSYPDEVSSATVRNVLAELEEEGYLTHPHTSAGRVPTELGYRYYVDHLMKEIEFLEEEKERIRRDYILQSTELTSLVEKVSRALSDTTQYTSIIAIEGWFNKFICTGTNYVARYPDYQDIQKIHDILSALDEKERLLQIIQRELSRKIDIYIGHEMSLAEMDTCSLVVSRFQTKSGTVGRMAILGPTRMHYDRVVSALEYFQDVMEKFN
jgi:transcriptional regulator of heat shock response